MRRHSWPRMVSGAGRLLGTQNGHLSPGLPDASPISSETPLRRGQRNGSGCATLVAVESSRRFTEDQARELGRRVGINWNVSRFDGEQFRMGLDVELEHGRRDPATNVSNDDEITTAKIALAHLNEFPDYYSRLEKMEDEARRYWSRRDVGLSD
jgi:hypothetical protein